MADVRQTRIPTALTPGTTLAGRYSIDAVLGMGGMGSVYKAHDAQLQRTVAIKVLNETKRLTKEAAATAQLTHPNIVKIHSIDVDEQRDQRFLVLEYIEGRTLRELVEANGAIKPQRAVEIAQQVLSALAHAHSQGVVHRDLKPQNIMLDEHGNVKILDFGIAKLIGIDDQRVTQTGEIIGTPEYISPEQCTAGTITSRTDIYAVGCCLHFMLTGKPPFEGESIMEVFLKQVHQIPTLSEIPDTRLANVVAKAMAKEPLDRYSGAEEMSEALAGKRDTAMAHNRPASSPDGFTTLRLTPRMVAALVGTIALGIAIGLRITPPPKLAESDHTLF